MIEEIKKYLKENLKINIETRGGEYGGSGTVSVDLVLEGEIISSEFIDGDDLANTSSQEYE